MGIAKGATSTVPERRGDGYCAKMETLLVDVKVLGMINLEVCVVGTIFLGEVYEPVRSAKDPYSNLDMGIPFNKKPKYLKFDIKAKVDPERTLLRATSMNTKTIEGHDEPEIYVFLQQRKEDANGNIYAKRIATAHKRFDKSIPEWINGYQLELKYGDITGDPIYMEDT